MQIHFQEQRWHKDLDNVKAEDVDWQAFQFGGRITGPFNARKLREWQLFRETTNGIAGLWMCHLIDLAGWYLEDPYPKHAVTLGGVYLWKDGRQTSDVFQSIVEYQRMPGDFRDEPYERGRQPQFVVRHEGDARSG
jgi:hypothetical protein